MHSVIEIDRLDDAPVKSLKLGMARTPVGSAAIAWDELGVRELSLQEGLQGDIDSLMPAGMTQSGVRLTRDDRTAAALLVDVFSGRDLALPLVLCGTPWQRQVWRALMSLELAQTVSYGELATRIGKPLAARAVGSAVGANVLGFVVPCHRVIRQDGLIGKFRWGTEAKRRLLAWEAELAR